MNRLFKKVIDFYWGEDLAYQTPALAFYLIISLAPLALGLTALAGLLFGDLFSPQQVAEELAQNYPVSLRDDIINLAREVRDDSPWLLALSIFTMLWTASAALGVIERTMTHVAKAPPFSMVWGRIRLVLLGLGFSLLVIIATLVASLAGGLIQIPSPVLVALTFVGVTLILALIYLRATSYTPPWKQAIKGAVPAAVVLQATPYLVGQYFKIASDLTPASIFLSMAVVVASCYLLATGILVGAGIAARPPGEDVS